MPRRDAPTPRLDRVAAMWSRRSGRVEQVERRAPILPLDDGPATREPTGGWVPTSDDPPPSMSPRRPDADPPGDTRRDRRRRSATAPARRVGPLLRWPESLRGARVAVSRRTVLAAGCLVLVVVGVTAARVTTARATAEPVTSVARSSGRPADTGSTGPHAARLGSPSTSSVLGAPAAADPSLTPGAGPSGATTGPPPGPPTAPPSGIPPPGTPGGAVGTPSAPDQLTVHVVGQVHRPGIVVLPQGARVAQAVEQAGGATSRADLTRVNLARQVVDGEQVYVPAPGETVPPAAGVPAGPLAGSAVSGRDRGGGAGGSGGSASNRAPVDLNRADATQLDALPGVGPVLAQRILDWRSQHGRFASVDELGEVSGIGEKLLAQLTPLVTV